MNLFTCHIVFVIQDQLIVDTVDVCCFFLLLDYQPAEKSLGQ